MKKVHNKELQELTNQTDSLTIYIKPKKGMINQIQDNTVPDQCSRTNEPLDQSYDWNREEKDETGSILGV